MSPRHYQFDFQRCKQEFYSEYVRNCGRLNKTSADEESHLNNVPLYLNRNGLNLDLRYSFDINGVDTKILYTRWAIYSNKGKSAGARIWFALLEGYNPPVIIFLSVYTHGQGVEDIERHEALSLAKNALREFGHIQ
jgi:hypothetical protein